MRCGAPGNHKVQRYFFWVQVLHPLAEPPDHPTIESQNLIERIDGIGTKKTLHYWRAVRADTQIEYKI